MMKKIALAVLATTAVGTTQAATVCVFDLLGAGGESYQQMKEWALAAKGWGADVTLKAYTDERVANEDFKAGKCDGVTITAMRGREYNKFAGSIDSIGGVPDNKVAQSAISFALNERNAAKMLSANKKYEVAGIAPMGAAYLFVNDRNINTVAKAAGKKLPFLTMTRHKKLWFSRSVLNQYLRMSPTLHPNSTMVRSTSLVPLLMLINHWNYRKGLALKVQW